MTGRAGKREDKILIEQPTQVKDEIGGYSTTWSQYANVWAHVEPMSGNEAFQYGQITQGDNYNIVLLLDDAPLINMNMRIRFNGVVLNIHSIVRHGRENRIDLVCYDKNS